MTREAAPIDLATMPDLARLANEVARDGTSRVLRQDGADVAVLAPVRPRRRRTAKTPTPAQREAVLATFGAWKGHLDAERFKREIKAARRDDRLPAKLTR
jgi:hypothetical protein